MTSNSKNNPRQTPEEQAHELLRERDLIRKHFANIAEMKSRLRHFEEQFSISSDQVHNAIERGDLVETDEVCEWLLTFEALQRSDAITAGR